MVEKKKRQADRPLTQDGASGSRTEEARIVTGDQEAVLEVDPNVAKGRRVLKLLTELPDGGTTAIPNFETHVKASWS